MTRVTIRARRTVGETTTDRTTRTSIITITPRIAGRIVRRRRRRTSITRARIIEIRAVKRRSK